jgi:broad specificity phosphatase PhoE
LTIVRHGQASFFDDDYDRLSPVGEEQGRCLGRYWASRRLPIDAVYTGPRLRQRQTAEFAGAAYRQAGFDWPDPIVLDDLDEYDLDGLVNRFAARLAARHSEFHQLMETHRRDRGERERLRSFQRMFEVLLSHWQAAETPDDDLESWPAFRQRVRRVIQFIRQRPGRGRRVAAFTSGGFIGCAVQHALGVSDPMALELNWRIRNGSLTEFLFTPERLTLDSFNAVPHLDDPTLWTYR